MKNLYKNLVIGTFCIGGAELAVFGAQAAAQTLQPLVTTHEVDLYPVHQNGSPVTTQWMIDRRDECHVSASYRYKHNPRKKTLDFWFDLRVHVPEGPSPNYPTVIHVSYPFSKALFNTGQTNGLLNKVDKSPTQKANFHLATGKRDALDITRSYRNCPDFEFAGNEFFEKASLSKSPGSFWKLNLTLREPQPLSKVGSNTPNPANRIINARPFRAIQSQRQNNATVIPPVDWAREAKPELTNNPNIKE